MLSGIVTAAIGQAPDIVVAGQVRENEHLATKVSLTGADAVIVQTDRPDAPESFMSLFRGCPALRVVAIDGDCSRGFLHELRPHSIRLPALSAEVLQSALQGQITMGDQRYRSK